MIPRNIKLKINNQITREMIVINKEDESLHNSRYDWYNIEVKNNRVGKIRTRIKGNAIIIYSINIFPKFERHGYAKRVVQHFQENFSFILADRVRHSAVVFWEKMGFSPQSDGNYLWERKMPKVYKHGDLLGKKMQRKIIVQSISKPKLIEKGT